MQKVFIYIDMARKISLSNGIIPTDSLLIPDVESIIKFSSGDLGISETIKKAFIYRNIAASNMDQESMEIYLKTSGMETTQSLDSYDTGERFRIPIEELELNPNNETLGLKALEKTVIKTIFETQKPYLEVAILFTESLVDIEDIMARFATSLALDGKSLRPSRNENSLFTKLGKAKEEVAKMNNLSKDKKGGSKFSKLTTEQKLEGINLDVLNVQTPTAGNNVPSQDGNKILITNKTDKTIVW